MRVVLGGKTGEHARGKRENMRVNNRLIHRLAGIWGKTGVNARYPKESKLLPIWGKTRENARYHKKNKLLPIGGKVGESARGGVVTPKG